VCRPFGTPKRLPCVVRLGHQRGSRVSSVWDTKEAPVCRPFGCTYSLVRLYIYVYTQTDSEEGGSQDDTKEAPVCRLFVCTYIYTA